MLLQQHYFSSGSLVPTFCTCEWHTFSGLKRCYRYRIRDLQCKVLDSTRKCQVQISDKPFDRGESNTYLQVQTLRNFPIEKLDGEVVVVRFDSTLLLQAMDSYTPSVNRALYTITYLSKAGAKVILVSSWGQPCNSKLLSVESLADWRAEFLAEGKCGAPFIVCWTPADLGPVALKEIFALLLNCKKVLWIGPVKFGSFTKDSCSTTELALMLEKISNTGCDVTVVGNAACKAVAGISSFSSYKMFENASVAWEFLQGRTLPGVAALDRAFLTSLDWDNIFADPTLPLIVDIGSGNGLFLFKLARKWKHSNFLGLEINNKLVKMCLDIIADSDIKNVYFISTNATSTFRSIVSSYPGELVLVSIQCPNPDFNKEEHRWRMVQKTLVEAIIDLLATNGKIFLQSDVKAVSTRMREQFVMYGKGKLVADMGDEKGWIEENPLGVRTDWEQHVVDRGDPMYRMMLKRVDGNFC